MSKLVVTRPGAEIESVSMIRLFDSGKTERPKQIGSFLEGWRLESLSKKPRLFLYKVICFSLRLFCGGVGVENIKFDLNV